jgi:hypothetical protein
MSQQESDGAMEGEIVNGEPGEYGLAKRDDGLRPIDTATFQVWSDSRQRALNILMEAGIAQTTPRQWINQGGSPYPLQGACSAIIDMVGINIPPPTRSRENFEDELGRYYIWFLESTVSVPKFGIGPIPIIGRGSSRDQFFAFKTETDAEGRTTKVLRPMSEIDPGDVVAKGFTNLLYRGVKAVVPIIAGLTWEELKRLTGGRVGREKVGQVHYGDDTEAPREGNCPTCHQADLILREGTSQKSGKPYKFWGCPRYPACKHMQNEAPAAATPATEEKSAGQPAGPPSDLDVALAEEIGKRGLKDAQIVLAIGRWFQSIGGQGKPPTGETLTDEQKAGFYEWLKRQEA